MQVLLPADQIQRRVGELDRRAAVHSNGQPGHIVGVLTGCLMFLADLVRQLDLPLRIDFIQASSYRGPTTTAGELVIHPGLAPDVRGRHVLLLDDILDTGKTLGHLRTHLTGLGPASLRIGFLLRKRDRQVVEIEPDYCGFEIPDAFVAGSVLDFNDDHPPLPSTGVLANSPAPPTAYWK